MAVKMTGQLLPMSIIPTTLSSPIHLRQTNAFLAPLSTVQRPMFFNSTFTSPRLPRLIIKRAVSAIPTARKVPVSHLHLVARSASPAPPARYKTPLSHLPSSSSFPSLSHTVNRPHRVFIKPFFSLCSCIALSFAHILQTKHYKVSSSSSCCRTFADWYRRTTSSTTVKMVNWTADKDQIVGSSRAPLACHSFCLSY